jgi:diketogulonate reductase-like aldo/keto reductase
MREKPFGHTGVDIPVIGQGSWNLPESGAGLVKAKRALLRGIELGMTHIDTAEMYGSGRVEELLGEVLADVRDKVFLASKVLPSNASFEGTIAACERSCRRLRTDRLDLFMLHWPGAHPIAETMRALETLVRQGKTRFIGVSNFEIDELREAQSHLTTERLACNQVLYHLNERGVEHRLIPYCRENGIAVVAYTPFGRGRYARAKGASVLEEVARKRGVTARQAILAFLTRDPIVFAIPKASSVEHVGQNAAVAEVPLDDGDVEAIAAAYPVGEDGPLATL